MINFSSLLIAQSSLEGFIYDVNSKEAIVGAVIFTSNENGVISNISGYFHLRYNPATDSIVYIQSLGYEKYSIKSSAFNFDAILTVYLIPGALQLEEIQIDGSVWQDDFPNPDVLDVPLQQVRNFPMLAGEADPIKYLQSLPGIVPGREGRGDLYVRGGSPDQNLFLIDNMPVFTIQHIGGLLSILDPIALKGIKLYKGAFPARYGGRLSSVVDIQLKDGNKRTWNKYIDIGVIAAKAAIEGPIIKDTLSTFLSLRRANTDLYTGLISLLGSNGQFRAGYTFYDLTAKADFRPTQKDQVALTFYGGLDKIFSVSNTKDEIKEQQLNTQVNGKINWTNLVGVVNWNRLTKRNHFRNIMFGFNRYQLNNSYQLERNSPRDGLIDFSWNQFSGYAWDLQTGLNYEYSFSPKIKFNYGIQTAYQRFLPGFFEAEQYGENVSVINQQYGSAVRDLLEFNGYADAEFSWRKFLFQPGLRLCYWANVYDQPHAEPRFAIIFEQENQSINASVAVMRQSMHLLSNNTAGVPIDLWVPSVPEAPPMRSTIYSVGYTRNISIFLFQISFYYKTYQEVIEFQEGKSFFGDQLAWNDKIVSGGEGKSYGIELYLRKKVGRLNGWLSYTYSRSLRHFNYLNNNKWFPYRYDRPNNASVFVNYLLKEGISIGVNWMYASGDAITLPIGKYSIPTFDLLPDYTLAYDDFPVHLYGERNGYRIPSTHRLDISLAFVKIHPKYVRTFKAGVYNAYNRKNPYYVYLDDSDGRIKLYKASLLPIFPFVSWSIVF